MYVELYYYGAPGEFAESDMAAAYGAQHIMPSYGDVAKKNAPQANDDYFFEDFEEQIARPYVLFSLALHWTFQ